MDITDMSKTPIYEALSDKRDPGRHRHCQEAYGQMWWDNGVTCDKPSMWHHYN